MIIRLILLISIITTLLITGCAGLQNSSYVIEDERAHTVPFDAIKQSTLNFIGVQPDTTDNKFTPADSGSGLFTRDSVNNICYLQFSSQFKKRFGSSIIQSDSKTLQVNSGYLLSVDEVHLAWTKERNLMADGGYAPIAMMKMWVTIYDLSTNSILFRLNSNSEVPMRRYAHPWNQAIKEGVASILDYIESEGREHKMADP
jgi:hypothetical protein